MKKLLKMLLKAAWRLMGPLRRPFARKFEALVARGCAAQNRLHVCQVGEETGLLMDLLVRELVRLQAKVERLQDAVEDLASAATGPDTARQTERNARRAA